MVKRPYSSSESSSDSEGSNINLLDTLFKLHADEIASLTQRLNSLQRRSEQSASFRSLEMIRQYILFLAKTWMKAAWASTFYPTTIMDRVSIVVLSFAACIIMSVMLPWCQLCNISLVHDIFDKISNRFGNGLSLVNAFYPTIFKELTEDEIKAARVYLSRPIKDSGNGEGKRVFNLDGAKLLMLCAALMYERSSHSKQKSTSLLIQFAKKSTLLSQIVDPTKPGERIRRVFGDEAAHTLTQKLRDGSIDPEQATIKNIAENQLGLKFLTISELNSLGSSYCGLFWHPEDTFIIASFKGTNPTDFMEWNTDFTFQMREAGQWLRGFGKVHNGFMKKVFPTQIEGSMPYDTIVKSIRSVADHLKARNPGQKINVWITGHSLGCALASLVYSRLIFESHELGDNVIVRDAYIFAAPILCDVESAQAFNNRMNHIKDQPRTMWRITNGNDFVATGLPDNGDNIHWTLSPWNLFSFAHLGCEIKMRDAPETCLVKGNLITPGTQVVIESAFKSKEPTHLHSPTRRTLGYVQRIPVVGRLLAHCTGFYWASLQGIQPGNCEWVKDDEWMSV